MSVKTFLREFELLHEFVETELHLLSTFIEERDFEDGEIIIGEKDSSRALYFVLQGKVRIHRELGGGRANLQHILEAREIFGEVAFSDGKGRTANVTAQGNVKLGVFEFEHFDVIKNQDPVFGMKLLMQVSRTLATKFRILNSSIERVFCPSGD